MVINEVYFGRVPEIETIYQEFIKLRTNYSVIRTGKNSKQTAKIEKLIEDFFGFSAFSLNINNNSVPNAYTYPVATSIDINPTDYLETTSKGYRFSKAGNVAAITVITKGLFANKAFSDEEAFAVLLHEIGHSFTHRSPFIAAQQDVYVSAVIYNIVIGILLAVLTGNVVLLANSIDAALSSSNSMKMIRALFQKEVKKVPILRELKVTWDTAIGLLSNILNSTVYTVLTLTGLSYLLNKLAKTKYDKVISKQIDITGNPEAFGRSMERLSDDFATMYGFSSALGTALVKMENPDNQGLYMKISHHIPVIGLIMKKTDALAMELNGLVGSHPSSPDRMLSILESMKTDLKTDKDMPEKVKKELRANIKKMEDTINDIKDNNAHLEKYGNEYHAARIVLGLGGESSEDFKEKRFTDREKLNKFYKERKVRKEQAKLEKQQQEPIPITVEEDFSILDYIQDNLG